MALKPEALYNCLKEDLSDTFGSTFLTECSGPMWPDMTLSQAAGQSIYKSFLKKIETGRTRSTDQRAEEKFLQCNELCRNWALPSRYDSRIETLLGEVRRAVYEFWFKDGESIIEHPYDILERGTVGPGVSIGSEGNSFYAKLFSSRLTCSRASLYTWYSRYIKSFPDWDDAEMNRESHYGVASVTPSNRLSFVPKNDEISRTICIEPTLDTIFQSGIGRILELRLEERFGIALSSQQFENRELARLGSLDDDIVTIDLSSASDTISLKMLEWLLPEPFFRLLCNYRSTHTEIKGRGTVELHMVSTMGNGFTFPLQTMLFCCAVVAAFRFRGIPSSVDGTRYLWGVNGDDIACPSYVSRDVIDLLRLLGFLVNHDKTFVEGPFRESCGHDYFKGSNIRGVYVKSLRSPGSRYSVINLLGQFSTRTGLFLPKTYHSLYQTVKPRYVPGWENIDSGIHTPISIAREKLLRDKNIFGLYYTALIPLNRKIRVTEESVVVPRRCKQLIYNPEGLMVSFLQGGITDSSIGIRDNTYKWIGKRRSTSSWDARSLCMTDSSELSRTLVIFRDDEWQRWESAVLTYLEREG